MGHKLKDLGPIKSFEWQMGTIKVKMQHVLAIRTKWLKMEFEIS